MIWNEIRMCPMFTSSRFQLKIWFPIRIINGICLKIISGRLRKTLICARLTRSRSAADRASIMSLTDSIRLRSWHLFRDPVTHRYGAWSMMNWCMNRRRRYLPINRDLSKNCCPMKFLQLISKPETMNS